MAQNRNAKNGATFNIQEYAVGDGPGIRTTIFLKGCPLRCLWCCNPEGQESAPLGKLWTAEKLFERVSTALPFFSASGGGVTLSGGEPFFQPEFAGEFIKLCKKAGLSVGVETCGYFDWDKVKDFIDDFDFYYFDIKTLDPKAHKKYIGKDNELILQNLKNLAKNNASKVTVTITVVPGVNDSEKSIVKIADLCKKAGIKKTRLLPYHGLGSGKYEELGRKYLMGENISVKKEFLKKFKRKIQSFGIKCRIE